MARPGAAPLRPARAVSGRRDRSADRLAERTGADGLDATLDVVERALQIRELAHQHTDGLGDGGLLLAQELTLAVQVVDVLSQVQDLVTEALAFFLRRLRADLQPISLLHERRHDAAQHVLAVLQPPLQTLPIVDGLGLAHARQILSA